MSLIVRDLNSFYGSSHALHDLSLEVRAGESVAVVGRNGAGKSTTLHSIMGLLPKVSGSVLLNGTEVIGRTPHAICRLGLGLVPETRRVFVDLTVQENLEVGYRRRNGEPGWQVGDMYDLFPLLERLRQRKAGLLSGGEQQLLAIARTVVGNPKLLLLDEPTEGLAPRIVEELEEQLLRLRDLGVTLLLSEQHLPFAAALTERAYIIEKGAICHVGPTADILASPELRDRYLAI